MPAPRCGPGKPSHANGVGLRVAPRPVAQLASPDLQQHLCQTLWRRVAVVESVQSVARRTEPQLGLGAALREFRVSRGLSQEELAHGASLHPTWISHLESGRENPSWGTVRRLASALDITLADLAARAEALDPKDDDRD